MSRAAAIAPLRRLAVALTVLVILLAGPLPALAESDINDSLQTVVGVDARIPSNARTAGTLGTTRQGSGVVISGDGLVLTIGYLVMEAIEINITLNDGRSIPASFVAYDHDSGFGLIRAATPIDVTPAAFGRSGDMGVSTQVLIGNRHGPDSAQGVFVVDRREFAGPWEYLLDSAIFTSPPNPEFSGAGLFDADGNLIGIGSLFVGNAAFFNRPVPGNMFVPIDELKPILDQLVDTGRRTAPSRPWLGVSPAEARERVFVERVSTDSPAARAGIEPGDLIVAVGDTPVASMSGYFRAIWRDRSAGDTVTLRLLNAVGEIRDVPVESMDRRDWLRLDPTL